MEKDNVIVGSKDLVVEESDIIVSEDVETVKFEIPEDERAVETEEPDDLENVKKLGFFSPVLGMVGIQGALEGNFYARIYRNEEGTRFIEYCQKYGDGTFSPKMLLPQSDMMLAAGFDFASKGISEAKVRNKVASFFVRASDDYFGKFGGNFTESYNILDILKSLLKALPSLPIYTEEADKMGQEELYRTVVTHVQETLCGANDKHKTYYAIDDEILQYVANAMEIKPKALLKVLKQSGLLYLPSSSRGYKTNVRVPDGNGGTFTEWMYCILKVENLVAK